jgi:hypothetical protein
VVTGRPSPRAAYITTKVVIFALAAVLTWPLSKVIGPRAWWGLGAFGLILAVMTLVVFVVLGRGAPKAGEEEEAGDVDFIDVEGDPAVTLPVEDALDLHPFAPRDIPDVVCDYLGAAHARGLREVRLIHGRGIGVQRERVRSVLANHPLVTSFHDATPDRGGWGATVAYLTNTTTVDA